MDKVPALPYRKIDVTMDKIGDVILAEVVYHRTLAHVERQLETYGITNAVLPERGIQSMLLIRKMIEALCTISINDTKELDQSQKVIALDVGDATVDEAVQNLVTHLHSWRSAIMMMGHHSPHDADYWKHELDAFDRTFNILNNLLNAPNEKVKTD